MVFYRRNRVSGGTYFFTANLRDRNSTFLVEHVNALRAAFREVRRRRSFTIDALVVLPDHLHAIWTLPPGDDDYPARWRAIKSRFTRLLSANGVAVTCNSKGEYNLWQRRYWEHTIRDENDLSRHIDYIHYNPVKHGYVESVAEWPFSSFHRFVKAGVYSLNWGARESDFDGVGHE